MRETATTCLRGSPSSFLDDVYPAYLEAMATRVNYFLSDIELLALARCAQQNVVIFVHDVARSVLTYARVLRRQPGASHRVHVAH